MENKKKVKKNGMCDSMENFKKKKVIEKDIIGSLEGLGETHKEEKGKKKKGRKKTSLPERKKKRKYLKMIISNWNC